MLRHVEGMLEACLRYTWTLEAHAFCESSFNVFLECFALRRALKCTSLMPFKNIGRDPSK